MNRRLNRLIILALVALVILLVLCSIASAQDHGGVTVTPIMESGSYSRTYTYTDPASGYASTGVKSDTIQKGFVAEFRGNGHWSSKIQFTTGNMNTPTRISILTDGRRLEAPYSQSSNATTTYEGNSRSLQVMEEYSRGFLTYRAGVDYRLLDYTDSTTFVDPRVDSSQSEFTDSFFGPRFGIATNPRFGKLGAIASVDVSPWMHRGGTYEFRLQNWGTDRYQGSTSSQAFDLNLGASYQITKNFGIVGGWRYSAVHTADSNFYIPNPYSTGKTPEKDSWKGIYIGLQLMH